MSRQVPAPLGTLARHFRCWTLDLWWHYHDQSPAPWLPRTKQNSNTLRIANMKNVTSVGLNFFQLIFGIWLSWNSPPKKKLVCQWKHLADFFFFFLDYEHSTFHPKLLACGLVVWGLLTLSAAIIHINTLTLLFVFKDCPLCVLTALPPTAGFNTGRNVLRELVPPTPASN